MLAHRQRGVSIIEAMIVLTVLVILLVGAVPTGREWLANSRIRAASESMLAGLQLARAEALKRNTAVEFVLDAVPAASWVVRVAATGEELQRRAAGEGTSDVTLAVTPGGATRISFDGLGRRTANVDASAPIDRVDLDLPATVLPPEKTRDLRLQVSLGGQVVLCDPNVTAASDVRRCP
ncbi:MAG TPA: GspH/FimT family pseudopilin [Zeimonas sp.]|jgi:type IV fimbrial biogenesis protein FimT|nr:GspH/FimT family pseudopilin [Zeimonas sp.]